MGFETALWPFLDLKKIKSPENLKSGSLEGPKRWGKARVILPDKHEIETMDKCRLVLLHTG